jgi:hypothetical protein
MSFPIPRLDTRIASPSQTTRRYASTVPIISVILQMHRYVQLSHRLAVDRILRPVHAGSSTTRANMPVSCPAVPA